MDTPEKNRREEEAAIERERDAFERRQEAFLRVHKQFLPRGNGMPTEDSMRELDRAGAEWKAAHAELERIVQEIRSGKRR